MTALAAEVRTPWTRRRPEPDPARAMTFYVGAHQPKWLETSPVPLFVSLRRLAAYSTNREENLPKARCLWALDSGGFTELSTYGRWTWDEDSFGGTVYRLIEEVGMPQFAAPMDWMCEPWITAKTGLDVRTHQHFTTENLLYLREHFPHAPWAPVLQGWTLDDYLRHAEDYAAAGIDLAAEPVVGLGSVCRRQSTDEIGLIVSTFAAMGLRLHGFGVKVAGLGRYAHHLTSADSLAWSFAARMDGESLPECEHRGPCNNCLRYAVRWREDVMSAVRSPKQESLDLFAAPA